MAATPRLKVHNPNGEYIASCKHYEDAACLIAMYGEGATVRHADIGSRDKRDVIWREGAERIAAGDSYDEAADIMRSRVDASFNRIA